MSHRRGLWSELPSGEAPGFSQGWRAGILGRLGLDFSKCKMGVGVFVSELPPAKEQLAKCSQVRQGDRQTN